ncbi:hypothetical protein [Thaumasiovibrio subtropicus]|uniref:hypothetical protein n=1 Tax=Thaumasiovibrio subtropicus TaxID=1891207 RepID=UPI000B356E85|nr:hypothetical protein [Thaumasiovibrio subtropicus]
MYCGTVNQTTGAITLTQSLDLSNTPSQELFARLAEFCPDNHTLVMTINDVPALLPYAQSQLDAATVGVLFVLATGVYTVAFIGRLILRQFGVFR